MPWDLGREVLKNGKWYVIQTPLKCYIHYINTIQCILLFKAIGRWRSKTKAKASLLRTEGEKTGGGPSKAIPLSDPEERLLQLVGWKAVTGDGNVELGMVKTSLRFVNLLFQK